jgi:hypothetical protein
VCDPFTLEIETTLDDGTGNILKNLGKFDVVPSCLTEEYKEEEEVIKKEKEELDDA